LYVVNHNVPTPVDRRDHVPKELEQAF